MPGRRGALPSVLKAIGLDSAHGISMPERRSETAPCPLCKSELGFDVDHLGRTVEICSNRRCTNAQPHAPTFDPKDLKPPERLRKKRKYTKRVPDDDDR